MSIKADSCITIPLVFSDIECSRVVYNDKSLSDYRVRYIYLDKGIVIDYYNNTLIVDFEYIEESNE